MENELALLEQKLAALIAHTRALRAANETLRRELARRAHERKRDARGAHARGRRAPRRADRAGCRPNDARRTPAWRTSTVQLDVTILGRDYKVACKEHERAELMRGGRVARRAHARDPRHAARSPASTASR